MQQATKGFKSSSEVQAAIRAKAAKQATEGKKVTFNGGTGEAAKWIVWELWGWNYNGPGWVTPLWKKEAEFGTQEQAEAAAGEAA